MKKTILLTLSIFLSISILIAQKPEKKELKPALLVIDVQNAYIPWMDQSDKDLAFEYINASIGLFEKYELPIIKIYHQDKVQGPAENSEEFKFAAEINMKDDYPMIIKHYGSAFTKTDLNKLLKEKEINTVFLCGLSATGCVLATFFGAYELDYNVFIIKDALLSQNADHTNYVEDIVSTINLSTLQFMLEYTQ
jgi:nicotinamidase-related amidase